MMIFLCCLPPGWRWWIPWITLSWSALTVGLSHPLRKLYYNMTITAASVIVALAIGGLEALGLIDDALQLSGTFWQTVSTLNDHMGNVGFCVVGAFVLFWLLSLLNYRWRGYDKITLNT